MRDAAARSVDVPHAASVFIEILAYRDCRVHPSHSARLRGRRSIESGFIDSAQPSVFWLHLRGGHPGGSSAGRDSGSEQAGCEFVPFDVSSLIHTKFEFVLLARPSYGRRLLDTRYRAYHSVT